MTAKERDFKLLEECPFCNAKEYFQPCEEEMMKHDWYSFEVVTEEGKKEHPHIKKWCKYSGDDIEGTSFVDCPYRHEGE